MNKTIAIKQIMKDGYGYGTVKTLRDALNKVIKLGYGDLTVMTEGCDCYGHVSSVNIMDDLVEIRRP